MLIVVGSQLGLLDRQSAPQPRSLDHQVANHPLLAPAVVLTVRIVVGAKLVFRERHVVEEALVADLDRGQVGGLVLPPQLGLDVGVGHSDPTLDQ
jgi:hypothetical protein